MVQENEIIVWILAVGALIFFWIPVNRARLKPVPFRGCMYAIFVTLFIAWTATIIEGFLAPNFFNILEHAGYALSAVLAVYWTWKSPSRGGNDRE